MWFILRVQTKLIEELLGWTCTGVIDRMPLAWVSLHVLLSPFVQHMELHSVRKQLSLGELLIILNRAEPAYMGLMQYTVQFSRNEMTYLFITLCKSLILSQRYIHRTITAPSQSQNIRICLLSLLLAPHCFRGSQWKPSCPHQDKGISSLSVPYLTASTLHPVHSHSPLVMTIYPI